MAKKTLWTRKLGGTLARPAVAGDVVVVGSDANAVHGVDAKKGKVKWKCEVDGGVKAHAVCDETTAYVGTLNRVFYAIDLATGTQRWATSTPNMIYYAAALAGDLVLVPGSSGALGALDTKTGELRWKAKVGASFPSTPTIDGEHAYVSCGKSVHAFALKNGRRAWKLQASGDIRTSPIVTDDRIFVAGGLAKQKGAVWAFDKATRKQKWSHELSRYCSGAFAVTDTTVIAGGNDLVGIDPKTGKKKWAYTKSSSLDRALAVDDELVVVCDWWIQKALIAVKGGKQSWIRKVDFGAGSPTMVDDVIYICADSPPAKAGTLYAIG